MDIYLVGGAVRDELLGRPVTEKDWVVVGATVDDMLASGFQPVGKEFPVFLHPVTKEEYALARTERKIGPGYKGFVFNTDVSVTLEEDLSRRDLTINAIAKASNGELIDPYGGREAIKQGYLRHVSPAFCEDPVRLLRVARFAAQLPRFTVASETMQLLQRMVDAGEVHHLVPERVWKECEKALRAEQASRFFDVLERSGALAVIFPEWVQWSFIDKAQDPISRFALLCYDLLEEKLRTLIKRLRCPNTYADVALLVNRYHGAYQHAATPEAWLSLLMGIDALRRPQRLQQLIEACSFIYGQSNLADGLRKAYECVRNVDVASVVAQTEMTTDLPGRLYAARLAALRADMN